MIKYAIAMAASVFAASSAHASDDWFEASSDHFKVYSEGTREDAIKLATNLERLDNALRMIRGLPTASEPVPDAVKLTVFQFGETRDIAQLYGNSRSGVAGFFIPRAGRSVAFVPLKPDREVGIGTRTGPEDIDPAKVLFHEYTHYFMFQNAAAAYPFWYTEGFAELFGTLQLTEKGFNLGEPPEHRADALRYLTIDVRKLFDPPKDTDIEMVMKQYAYGWMAVSYLSFEPSRKGQLVDYLKRINAGEENLVAAEHAFGDLDKLQKELEAYKKGRARAISVTYANYTPPPVKVRAVGEDEAARMRMHIRSTRGVTKRSAAGLIDGARQLVAKYPASVPVLIAATEAEFDASNYDQAEQLAKRALAADPNSVDAHLYLARIALERAKTDAAQFKTARAEYVAANHIDPNQPQALAGYYTTYELAGETPPEDALIALDRSYDLASFDSGIRMTLAHQLLLEKRDREALILLGPITNDPHSGKQAEKFRALVDKLKAGDRDPLIAKLAPKIDPEEDEEDGG
jgi:tetratricopeptide (TPR) repeat protein